MSWKGSLGGCLAKDTRVGWEGGCPPHWTLDLEDRRPSRWTLDLAGPCQRHTCRSRGGCPPHWTLDPEGGRPPRWTLVPGGLGTPTVCARSLAHLTCPLGPAGHGAAQTQGSREQRIGRRQPAPRLLYTANKGPSAQAPWVQRPLESEPRGTPVCSACLPAASTLEGLTPGPSPPRDCHPMTAPSASPARPGCVNKRAGEKEPLAFLRNQGWEPKQTDEGNATSPEESVAKEKHIPQAEKSP